MVRRIRVMADYFCYPLWEDGPGTEAVGNIDPATLGLPADLVDALEKWAKEFDSHLDMADPASSPPWPPEEWERFTARGRDLTHRLAQELDGRVEVRFHELG